MKTLKQIGGVERFRSHFVRMNPDTVMDGFADPNAIIWVVSDEGEYAKTGEFGDLCGDTVYFDTKEQAEEHAYLGFFEGDDDNDEWCGIRRMPEVYLHTMVPGAAKAWDPLEDHLRQMREFYA